MSSQAAIAQDISELTILSIQSLWNIVLLRPWYILKGNEELYHDIG